MPSQFTQASPGPSMTTATAANIVSALLPAGNYLVWGQVNFALSAATVTETTCGLSLTSGTLPTQAGGSGLGPDPLFVGSIVLTLLTNTASVRCGATVLTITTPTTLYLVARSTFSAGSMTCYGTLSAIPVLGTGFNLIAS